MADVLMYAGSVEVLVSRVIIARGAITTTVSPQVLIWLRNSLRSGHGCGERMCW